MFSLWLACAASEAYLRPATALQSIVVVMSSSGVPKSGFSSTSIGDSSIPASRQQLAEAPGSRSRRPRCSRAWPGCRSRRRGARHAVGLNVVGVPVEAVLVVGDDHLRLVRAHQLGQARPPPLRPGSARRSPARRSAASPPCPSRGTRAARGATRRGRRSWPRAPYGAAGPPPARRAGVIGLHPAGRIAQLAVGARDQHGAHALVGVPGQDPARPDGLVVGVGVHGHQGEGSLGHAGSVGVEERRCAASERSGLQVADAAGEAVAARRASDARWRHRPHDELREPDLEEPLDHGAQPGEPDRDDLLERPARAPGAPSGDEASAARSVPSGA